jgi:hypothetical protein
MLPRLGLLPLLLRPEHLPERLLTLDIQKQFIKLLYNSTKFIIINENYHHGPVGSGLADVARA